MAKINMQSTCSNLNINQSVLNYYILVGLLVVGVANKVDRE